MKITHTIKNTPNSCLRYQGIDLFMCIWYPISRNRLRYPGGITKMADNRHAYLIMAHHRPDLLVLLLEAIDDVRNDIYLHIDAKSSIDSNIYLPQKSNLYFIPRNNVQWAGYSQVDCTLKLLKAAVQNGPYQYYHFLTGSTFPLKNQDDMHAFFDAHKGTEFVGFDNHTTTIERVKYYHLFHESGKLTGLSGHIKSGLRESLKFIQKLLSVDLFKKYHLEYKKGFAYWSITDDAARYLIDHEAVIYRMLRYSISGDEVFVQVLLYNSQFKSKLYSLTDEWEGSLRECAWGSNIGVRPGCNYTYMDLEYLLNSNLCFALKFEGADGLALIKKIKEHKKIQ